MKRILESKLDSLKASWLEDFAIPSTSITDDIGENALLKAHQYLSEHYDVYHIKIRDTLSKLPIGQEFMGEEWYRVNYVNELTEWIVRYKAIESVSDELLQRVREDELQQMLLVCEDAFDRCGISIGPEDNNKPFDYDSIADSDLSFETFKKAFIQNYPVTCSKRNSKFLDEILKRGYTLHENQELKWTASKDKKHTGKSEGGFQKRLIIGLVETAKLYFKSDRWKKRFTCTPYCKLKNTVDCLYSQRKINSLIDCEYNNKASKYLTGCYKKKNCKNRVNGSCKNCDHSYSHIGCVKKVQNEICTDGIIPEIAYLSAKMGILRVKKCTSKGKGCIDTDCLTLYCKKNMDNMLNSLKTSTDSQRKNFYQYITENGIPSCSREKEKLMSEICNKCSNSLSEALLRTDSGSIIHFKTSSIYGDRDLSFSPCKVLNEIKTLRNIFNHRSNPCPPATKHVYEIVSEINNRWLVKWDVSHKNRYTRIYYEQKTKTDKSRILEEISHLTNIKDKKRILQDIRRIADKLQS